MIRIIHVSDLHFHEENEKNEEAEAFLYGIGKKYAFGPDSSNYLLVTGDIVDDGSSRQYRNAFEALKPFKDRLLIVPGNHDYGICGNLYSNACARAFDDTFKPLWDKCRFYDKEPVGCVLSDGHGTEVLAVGLNSVLKTHSPLDLARGEIGEGQLDKLNAILSKPEYADKPKIVFLHHRPQKDWWFFVLTDSEDMMAILSQNRVAIVAFGHSGGDMRSEEPPQARIMNVIVKRYGIKYLLNANSSVSAGRCYEITIEGKNVKEVKLTEKI